jgi:hypothetical protein
LLNEYAIAVLDRLLGLTKQGRLVWQSDTELDFFAPLGESGPTSAYGHVIAITRIWTEVVGRAGADPYQIELTMPAWSVRFPLSAESEGCKRLCAILEAGGHSICCEGGSAPEALEFLNTHLPE